MRAGGRWESARLYTEKLFEKKNVAAAKSMLEAIRAEFHEVGTVRCVCVCVCVCV